MSDESRSENGQFSAAEEPKYGLAGVEQAAGYVPMAPPEPPEEQAEYETAAAAFAAMPPEPEEPEVERAVYRNLETLEPSPANHTVSLERAAQDMAAYEANVVDSRARSIDASFADVVAEMRGDFLAQAEPEAAAELGLAKEAVAKPVEAEQVAQPEQPDPYDVEGLSEDTKVALKTNPQLRSFIEANAAETEQTVQALKTAVSHNQTFGQAAIITLVPEFGQYSVDQWPQLIGALKQAGDPRGQQVENLLGNVQLLNQRQQVVDLYVQHQQQAQFEGTIKSEDQRLVQMAGSEKAANEVNAALFNYLSENGVPRDQYLNVIRGNPVLATAEARQTVWKAARYDEMQKTAKAIPSRPIPTVQKPGHYVPRATGPSAEIAALQRSLDGKTEEQQKRIARRIINLQAS